MSDMRSSKELVKSLRDYSEGPTFYWGPICQKAAEEIERLQRELAASAAQYQEACDDANRFARERDEARASSEPADDLYALLVRRGYAQHEAHAIAFGDKLAVLSSSQPPSAVLVNAFRAGAFYGCAEEFNPLDLQRDAEAYGSRHSPTKGDAQ